MRTFLEWGRRQRRWADSTCDGYRRRITAWLEWCHANKVRQSRATPRHVNLWLDTLHPTPAVRSAAHTALLAWFDYLVYTQTCKRNPVKDVPRVPVRRVIPRSLEPEAVTAILRAATAHGDRWGAYVGFLAYGGLRRVEACRLRWVDIEGHDAWVRVLGKGNQEGIVPIHAKLRPLILAWRSHLADPVWLFPGRDYGQHMSIATATKHMRIILDAAGLPNVTGHQLRHSLARRLIEVGVDVPTVAATLRHGSIGTTMTYVRARPHNVAAAVAQIDY